MRGHRSVRCGALVVVVAVVVAVAVGSAGWTRHTPTPAGHTAIAAPGAPVPVRVYLTTATLSQALARQPDLALTPPTGASRARVPARRAGRTIVVDERTRYQRIDGFGAAMTDTSAWLLYTGLTPAQRESVLHRLFDPTMGIGISFMRLPMGASDYTRNATPYSYDDMPGPPMRPRDDPALAHFSIDHDLAYIIPALRYMLRINPAMKIMANPWSPPAWMKSNRRMENPGNQGYLLARWYAPLASYFVRFVRAYRARGIPIYAISPNNEPRQFSDYPGLDLPAAPATIPATAPPGTGDESDFIQGYLGPALARNGLLYSPAHPTGIKLLGSDNAWGVDPLTEQYPFTLMRAPGVRQYLAGTSWHCYLGNPAQMSAMHAHYPGKDNDETECSSGIAPGPVAELIIASARNWANAVLLWNVAVDQQGGPRQGSGCKPCYAPVTVDTRTRRVTYTGDYYGLGQASRFVRPGAYRIASNTFVTYQSTFLARGPNYATGDLDDVAFQNPDGSTVLLAFNNARSPREFAVRRGALSFRYSLPPGAAVTFVWRDAR